MSKRVTILLTGDNENALNRLIEQTGYNVNRLLNALISNARLADVTRREPVAVIGGEHDQRAAELATRHRSRAQGVATPE